MDFLDDPQMENWEREQVMAGGEVLLWDDAVHESLESRQLYFWRLSFSPRYDREKVSESLRHFYGEAGITSFVVYETLGDFDLLLRVWAPRAHNAEELELLLRQSLEGCYLWNLNYLACKTELHFLDRGSRTERPEWNVLDAVGVQAIEEVNQYNQEQWHKHVNREVTAGTPAERPPEIEKLIEADVLRVVPMDARGIRMFITFDHPRQPLRPQTRARVIRQIRDKCEDVRRFWEGHCETLPSGEEVEINPPNISIYTGAGSMTDFMIMARAPHKYFHRFVHHMIFGIRDIGLDDNWEMRPYTHVMADRMFSSFKEHRVVAAEAGDLGKLVHREESESLELKATLATNFRSLVAAKRRDADPRMLDEVVRAVCGFLNSPKGGTLIIGVLEVRRELEKARDRQHYLRVLKGEFEYSPAAGGGEEEYPNAVIGIEVDLDPGPFKDLDQYQRHLREALKAHIEPNPWPWLRMELEEVEGRHVCALWVRPGDVWFSAKVDEPQREEFFVREGASTPALTWFESDRYKQVYPRGSAVPSASDPQEQRD